jgi:anti-sigma B factor antagonist
MQEGTGRDSVITTIEVVPGERPGDRPMVVVRGEVDVATSPRLRSTLSTLLAGGATSLALDFSGVTFIDSSGLGVLVGALKRVQEGSDGHVQIVGATEFVRKIFQITGLEVFFLDDAGTNGPS